MPAICKCIVPGCTFEGNHGFTQGVAGTRFYHSVPGLAHLMENTHFWFSTEIDKDQIPNVKTGTVREYQGKHYLDTTDQMEAFELSVAVRIAKENAVCPSRADANNIWLSAWRAELTGKLRTAKRLFAEWKRKANG